MALHLFENGDTREMRRYRSARWREFAERPEVSVPDLSISRAAQ